MEQVKQEQRTVAEPAASSLGELLDRQRDAILREGAPDAAARKAHLAHLAGAVLSSKEALADAIDADFGGRSRHETLLAEIYVSVAAIHHARRHVGRWMRARSRSVSWLFRPARATLLYQPLGVVGIIAPWNYPVQLTLSPLAGALAAGNRVMIKPSELTPRTSQILSQIIAEHFPPEQIAVVTGGPEVGRAFSALPFDHLLFTGSTAVGRAVMRAASENLTPVTLELGGKSPAIIGEGYSLERAAASLIGGKLFNAGQTCIAPDYVLVPAARVEELVAVFRDTVTRMYPRLGDNPDYTNIISERHWERLRGYIEDARIKGAEIVEINPAGEPPAQLRRKIPPTLLLGVNDDMAVMQEEIFGPVLPVLPYEHLDEAIQYVQTHPRPLALYLFSSSRADVDRVKTETISGGLCINETLAHVVQDDLPFGGVGPSGMGEYHGFEGFQNFSKKKPVFIQSRFNTMGLLRPPYGKTANRVLRFLVGR